VLRACLADNASQEECYQQYRRVLAECLEQCGEVPPPEEGCEERCEARAQKALEACLAENGSERECRQAYERALTACLEQCGGDQEVPFLLALSSARVSECTRGTVFVRLTNRAAVQAFSFGVAHDPAAVSLAAMDYEECPALAGLNDGAGPDYFEVDLDAGSGNCDDQGIAGGTVYAIASQQAPSTVTIPPGFEQRIVRLTYDAVQGDATEEVSPVRIVGCLGDERPWPVVLTVDFQSVEPQREAGMLSVAHGPCLLNRGDSNSDGKKDLADAVTILGYLFEQGTAPVLCEDAADSNDDGRLDIGDAIGLLVYFFRAGGPLPAPGEGCGIDPTEDGLTCADFPPCR
jgi:hypothetical protein